MPRDPYRLDDTRTWLDYAKGDLATAEDLLRLPTPHARSVVFHCQQAAERALKASLTWHDRPFGKIHSLEELGESCAGVAPSLGQVVDRAVPLSKYASRFRYPGAPYAPKLQEAERALELAREVMRAVLTRLPDEVQPLRGGEAGRNFR